MREYTAEIEVKFHASNGWEAWNKTKKVAEEIAKYLPKHDRPTFFGIKKEVNGLMSEHHMVSHSVQNGN